MASLVSKALGIFVAILLAVTSVRAQSPHDGEWLVELTTQSGPCRSKYSFSITVSDGVISGEVTGRTGTYAISGRMVPEGRFDWTTSGGPDPGRFEGSISGERSEGQWSTQSGCRGVLTMDKKK
jgi:hypothetical protein